MEKLIQAAIAASEKSKPEEGKPTPPPRVGAAILFPDGEIVSASRGELGEGDHAEFTLLEKKLKGRDLSGCILATTLEPCTCRSPGKTPCCDRIIASGIKRVVIGTLDPNPDIYGHGSRKLKNSGVHVDFFPTAERDRVAAINSAFIGLFSGNQALEGKVQFDYEKNGNNYVFGSGDCEFITHWTTANEGVIHCYKTDSFSVSPCDTAEISEVTDAAVLDYSHRTVTASKGEIVLGRNRHGRFIAIKILDVSPRKPHQLSSILKVAYKITKNAKGDFSGVLESAYPLDDIRNFDQAWINETITKAFRTSVLPVLKRVHSVLETMAAIQSSIGEFMLVPKITWERTKTEYDPLRIKTVRDEPAFKTFKVTVSRKATEEETISRELREVTESWEIDVRLDLQNGIPSSLNVTRIYDTSTNVKAEWNDPLPAIDVKEYF
jgi:pyrimidine deaminase RibD-like protein